MILLALDLATETGVAVGDTGGAPICSHERLGETGGPHPARFSQMLHLTSILIERHNPELIAIEKALAGADLGGESRSQLAMGWRACVMAVSYRRKVRVVEYPVSSIRAHFVGKGAKAKGAGKALTLDRCARLGWPVANHNEADAAALWAFARFKHTGRVTPAPFGLFDEQQLPRSS